ncbi:MAG: 2-succinyl-5-enolpyruvyl-6-hydroxy-3-cyclohexene-1-carboxylic-acid synthase [Bifidobacteriaceae bacterium]|nr:2-succinyl-5-enolpyruvyl-6-hydroxy-3-cyclohexene-1-carboxylic-acid synthase [Bifidobacteriaceae bacterium]
MSGQAWAVRSAEALMGALIEAGVRDLVLSPGSRSAPLVYAAEAARQRGDLRVWVRLDERCAGFMALGLSLADPAHPAAVATTSGTAAANLYPAVVEASYAGVPLLVLTADRPAELHGVGANQTIEQRGMFASAPRASLTCEAADGAASLPMWRAAGFTGVRAAHGRWAAWPGPVHLNLRFRDPLTPGDLDDEGVQVPRGPRGGEGALAAGEPAGRSEPTVDVGALALAQGPRSVVVAGAGAGAGAREFAERAGWPLLAEPQSGSWAGPAAVPAYREVLAGHLGEAIQRVVVWGRPTLSRGITRLVAEPDVEVIVVHPRGGPWFDPARRARRIASRLALDSGPSSAQREWAAAWRAAGAAAWRTAWEAGGGPAAAHVVASSCVQRGAVLHVAASGAIRYLDLGPAPDAAPRVFASRGAAGIDGTLSTAAGIARRSEGPVRVLIGDLAFLHDAAGLAAGEGEREPSMEVVVLNDHGGGIFKDLEHAQAAPPEVFSRYFLTPQRTHVAALARAYGAHHEIAKTTAHLRRLLDRPTGRGTRVIEVPLA